MRFVLVESHIISDLKDDQRVTCEFSSTSSLYVVIGELRIIRKPNSFKYLLLETFLGLRHTDGTSTDRIFLFTVLFIADTMPQHFLKEFE